jgi:UDP-2,4-diacetamido-2,4,6-trideoxy-beta-L-altropyranose hydrolase
VFLGPRYALLRAEFDSIDARLRNGGFHRLLVSFGGTDPSNESLKFVSVLRMLGPDAPRTKLVLGPVNPHTTEVRAAASGIDAITVIERTTEMAALIYEADLGIGTCGVAAWERCLLGLPTLVVVTADNQRDDARILDSIGAARNLGDATTVSVERWAQEIRALRINPIALARMSHAALQVMHGHKDAILELETALAA